MWKWGVKKSTMRRGHRGDVNEISSLAGMEQIKGAVRQNELHTHCKVQQEQTT